MKKALAFLKKSISDSSSVGQIVDVFETMSKMRIRNKGDMLLYETGTFSFTGEPLFYFSLTRQGDIPRDDEFIQLHVDILFEPDQQNARFSQAIWNEDIDGDFFDYVRNSPAFTYAEASKIAKVEIWMDRT